MEESKEKIEKWWDSMKSQAFADELPKTISKLNERIAALDAEIERLKLCSNISSEE